MRHIRPKTIAAVLATAAALGGCIALPDYTRSESSAHFQAVLLADLGDGKAVYLVNQCGDRFGFIQACSERSHHGQYLTVQPPGWQVRSYFSPSGVDLMLSQGNMDKYVGFAPALVRDPASAEVLVGDFFSMDGQQFDSRAMRVWLRAQPRPGFRTLKVAAPPPIAGTGQGGEGGEREKGDRKFTHIWPMKPTLACRRVSTEYRVDAMVLPLPHTVTERKLGSTNEDTCSSVD